MTPPLPREFLAFTTRPQLRQGRPFWHYGKDIDSVRIENATFSERSDFLGAYCGDELIGFIKLVYMGQSSWCDAILIKDKRPR